MKKRTLFALFAFFLLASQGFSTGDPHRGTDAATPSRKVEKKLNKALMKACDKDKETATLSKDAASLRQVQNVSAAVFKAAKDYLQTIGGYDRFRKLKWSAKLVENPVPFLYFTPEGTMVVNTGLLQYIENDSDLGQLMSHELAHVILGHNMARLHRIWQGLRAEKGGFPLFRKGRTLRQSVSMAYALDGHPSPAFPYQAGQEDKADELGLYLAAIAGCNPYQAPTFWQRLGLEENSFHFIHAANGDKTERLTGCIPRALEYARLFGTVITGLPSPEKDPGTPEKAPDDKPATPPMEQAGASDTPEKTEPPAPAISYKIQLMSVGSFNPDQPKLQALAQYGSIETEYYAEKNKTRVLLSGFNDWDAANRVLQQVRDYYFSDAFVVEYENGKRLRSYEKPAR